MNMRKCICDTMPILYPEPVLLRLKHAELNCIMKLENQNRNSKNRVDQGKNKMNKKTHKLTELCFFAVHFNIINSRQSASSF